jgi:transketolase
MVVAPADNFETEKAIELAAELNEPVYIRFGKKPMPYVHELRGNNFAFGKGRVLTRGSDVAIIACGETVYPAFQAANSLMEKGVAATVVSMHTIKPLDTDLLAELASQCKAVVTIEEHSVYGGLGEACASYLMQHGIFKPFRIMGIPDEYTVTGSQQDIFNHYGICEQGITDTVLALVKDL